MPAPAAWYFAYASNMSRKQMSSRAEVLEEYAGKLENYELVFNKKVRGGVATANVRQAPGKIVQGVLYRITESSFRNLDRFEGVPQHYRRTEVNVGYGEGKSVPAQIYIATKVDKGLRPAPHYLQTILEGAAEHDFPAEYVEKIKAAAQGG
ncbi:MAG: gamma-glutamylcyclotransferase family protein [Candidatus Acidiferrales bacterium]